MSIINYVIFKYLFILYNEIILFNNFQLIIQTN